MLVVPSAYTATHAVPHEVDCLIIQFSTEMPSPQEASRTFSSKQQSLLQLRWSCFLFTTHLDRPPSNTSVCILLLLTSRLSRLPG